MPVAGGANGNAPATSAGWRSSPRVQPVSDPEIADPLIGVCLRVNVAL